MRTISILTTLGLTLALGTALAAEPLANRVAPPAPSAIALFESAGMRDVRAHVLTPRERLRVEAALAALPAPHRKMLESRLRHLSFVDGIPGHGTGLTAPVDGTDQFDITFRADLIDESLSSFLTTKERRLFVADGSGHSIVVEGTGTDALTYVLLHEATHVIDIAMGLAKHLDGPFLAGIWVARRELAPHLASSAAATTTFRGGRPIPVGQAVTIYDALAETPFVSLYATTTAQEDLAELVAWDAVQRRFGGTLVISILDVDGTLLKRYEPLGFPGVKARMARVDELLGQVK